MVTHGLRGQSESELLNWYYATCAAVHEIQETCHSVAFYFTEKLIFPSIAGCALYLIWLGRIPALIILGKMHFLPISENEFFSEIKCNGITSFMDFMICFQWMDERALHIFHTSGLGGRVSCQGRWKLFWTLGRIMLRGNPCHVLFIFLINISMVKHYEFGELFPPQKRGSSPLQY